MATGILRVTPMGRLLRVRLPGRACRVLAWAWPAAVEVEWDGGRVEVHRVQDTTRLVVMLLAVGAALAAAVAVRVRCARR